MSRKSRGKRIENEVVAELDEITNEDVRVIPAGYSGNHGSPSGDIEVTAPSGNHSIELKTTTQSRFSIPFEDLQQLTWCMAPHTRTWVAVKFMHRECVVAELTNTMEPGESLVADTPAVFAPRTGHTGSFILEDPYELGYSEEWPSQRNGRSIAEVLRDTLELPSADAAGSEGDVTDPTTEVEADDVAGQQAIADGGDGQ